MPATRIDKIYYAFDYSWQRHMFSFATAFVELRTPYTHIHIAIATRARTRDTHVTMNCVYTERYQMYSGELCYHCGVVNQR